VADDDRYLRLVREGEKRPVGQHPIPDGLTIERDVSTGEPKGLLVFWWTVEIARVDHDPTSGEIVVTETFATKSSFTLEGIGMLNGWIVVALPEDVMAALGEL
jgi:hypothetical protein